jgi:exopolysaccharide production protein ExoZ
MVKVSNIQFLRFTAAMMVVTSHIASRVPLFAGQQETKFWEQISVAGSYGVDIFFVISGYVIADSYKNQTRSPFLFLKLRFFRIYPLYAAVTTLFFLLHLIIPSMMNSSNGSIKLFLGSLTFTSSIFGFSYPILPQGWTLEIEVFFYLIFVVSIILCSRFKLFSGKEGLLSIVFILSAVFFGATDLMIEFIFGLFISMYSSRARKFRFILLASVCITIFVVIYLAIDVTSFRFFWIGLPCALLVYLAIATPQLTKKSVNFLGDISYSIYLVHGMLIAVSLRLFTSINEHSIPIFFGFIFTTVVAISGCTYLLFEKPIISYSKNRWGASVNAKNWKGN